MREFRIGLVQGDRRGDLVDLAASLVEASGVMPDVRFRIFARRHALCQDSLALLRAGAVSLHFLERGDRHEVEQLLPALRSGGDHGAVGVFVQPGDAIPTATFERVRAALSAPGAPDGVHVCGLRGELGEHLPAGGKSATADVLTGRLPAAAFFMRTGALPKALSLTADAGDAFAAPLFWTLLHDGVCFEASSGSVITTGSNPDGAVLDLRAAAASLPAVLKTTAAMLRVEQNCWPRFGLLPSIPGSLRFISEPSAQGREIDSDAFTRDLAALARGGAANGPLPQIVIAGSEQWEAVRSSRLGPWLLAEIEQQLRSSAVVTVQLARSADGAIRYIRQSEGEGGFSAHFAAVRTETVVDTVRSGRVSEIADLVDGTTTASISRLVLESPFFEEVTPHATPALRTPHPISLLARLMVRARAAAPDRLPAPDAAVHVPTGREVFRALFDAAPPALLDTPPAGGSSVAFLLPVFSFGGVERVCLRIAENLRADGFTTTLMVADRGEVWDAADAARAFDHIHLLTDASGRRESFWERGATWRRAVDIAGQADVFMPINVAQAPPLVEALRAAGRPSVTHLHSWGAHEVDGGPVGHPHIMKQLKRDLRGVLTVSRRLADWCVASGFRREDVLHIPNASSHLFSSNLIEEALAEKRTRPAHQPLRVLYVGRFDPEKGLARIIAAARYAADHPQELELRLVGGRVFAQEGDVSHELAPLTWPATFDPDEIAAHYAWADVLLTPSFFEGVPLTILEAALFGVVPVATRVGAIDEVVIDGETGLLVPADAASVSGELLARLRTLAADRALLKRLSAAATRSDPAEHWRRVSLDVGRFLRSISLQHPLHG